MIQEFPYFLWNIIRQNVNVERVDMLTVVDIEPNLLLMIKEPSELWKDNIITAKLTSKLESNDPFLLHHSLQARSKQKDKKK